MNKKSNIKGFTLIEMLAAIVILGIISSIAIVSVINLRKNQENKFDQNQLQVFKQTAKDYFNDHKSIIPVKNGESSVIIRLSDLIEENYIDSLLTYNKKSYSPNSYVKITKIGTKYIYEVFLCKEEDDNECTKKVPQKDKNKGDIKFKYDGNLKKYNNDDTQYSNNSVKVKYNVYDNDGIKTLRYFIYRNRKKIYTSEPLYPSDNNLSEYEDTITLNVNDREDGKYEIEVEVFDNNDISTIKKIDPIYLDTKAPTCTVSGGSIEWINKKSATTSRTIKAECTDIGSGCIIEKVEWSYSKDIDTTRAGAFGGIGIDGRVSDKAGNEAICAANQTVRIDKTPPTCTVSGGSSNWINKKSATTSRTIKADCKDTGSGCAEDTKSFSTAYSTDINTTTAGAKGNNNGGKVKDIAGNETICAANQTVRIDKTPPTCTVSGGSSNWINKKSATTSRTIKAECRDVLSGCVTKPFSKTYTDDINTTTAGAKGINYGGYVEDKARNQTECAANQTVKIDKTPPEITLKIISREKDYPSEIADVTVEISDNNKTKYDINKKEPSIKNYSEMKNVYTEKIEKKAYINHDKLDGKTTTVYVTARDEANNIKKVNESYTVYKKCNNRITNKDEKASGKCSVDCGYGNKLIAFKEIDMYFPDTVCRTFSVPSEEKCFSGKYCPGHIYVGNTVHKTSDHWPCKSYPFEISGKPSKCPNAECGYWFYWADANGNLWTFLSRNPYYGNGMPEHAQWACPPQNEPNCNNPNADPDSYNDLKLMVGHNVEIGNDKYQVIDDSNDFWRNHSHPCYSSCAPNSCL